MEKNNILDYSKVVKELTDAFNDQILKITSLTEKVTALNTTYSKIPSEYLANNKNLSKSIIEVQKAEQSLLQTNLKAEQVKKAQLQTTITNNRLKQQENIINSKLAGAYQELNQKHKQALNNYRNLIVKGKEVGQSTANYNNELRKAKTTFEQLDAKIKKADKAVGVFNRNVGNYSSGFLSFSKNLIGAFGIFSAVDIFANLTRSAYQTTIQIESLDFALKNVTGSNEQFTSSVYFLKDISEKYGQELLVLQKSYSQFYISSKNAGLEVAKINNIFESVIKASSSMGLATEDVEGALRALTQMISKGNIQAEELRGQLSERLPGAFGIMAKSMGVTEGKLNSLLKQGKVLAKDVLPAFAIELERTYGIENLNRIDNLVNANNRLKNSWVEFVKSLSSSKGILYEVTNSLAKLLGRLAEYQTKGYKEVNLGFKTKEEVKNKVINYYENELKGAKDYEKTLANIQEKIIKNRNENLKIYRDLKGMTALQVSEKMPKFSSNLTENKNFWVTYYANIVNGNDEALSIIDERHKESVNDRIEKEKEYVELNKKYLNKNVSNENLLKLAKSKTNKQLDYEIEKLKELSKVKKEDTKKEKTIKHLEPILLFTEKYYTDQINKLEELRSKTASTTEEYAIFTKQIELLQKALNFLKNGLDIKEPDMSFKNFNKDAKELQTTLDELEKKHKEFIDNFRKGFVDDLVNQTGLETTFDLLSNGLDKWGDNWKDKTLVIMESMQEMFNFINQNSQQYFDAEYNRLEQQKEYAMQFTGDSAEAKERIENEYNERRKKIAKKEAQQKKRQALFNIAIDTAQAVIATLGKTGFFGIPLSIIVGAMGAAQMALVASQKVPEFWQGTQNAPEGIALVDEKRPEIHTDKKGNIKSFGKKSPNYRFLEKGDKIYKSHDDYLKTIVGNGNNYSFTATKTENLSKIDFDNGINSLINTIQTKEGINISIDKQGFSTKINGFNNLNNRVNFKGKVL